MDLINKHKIMILPRYNFESNYRTYRNLLIELRDEEKNNYQSKIIYHLFFNLFLLKKIFLSIDSEFFTGKSQFDDFISANKYMKDYQDEFYADLNPKYYPLYLFGVQVYHLNSLNYNDKIRLKSNIHVEEFEFTFITYLMVRDFFVNWVTFGLIGYSKKESYRLIATEFQVAVDVNSFENLFNAFMQQVLFKLVGVEDIKGKKLINNTLYKPLPNFYKSNIFSRLFRK